MALKDIFGGVDPSEVYGTQDFSKVKKKKLIKRVIKDDLGRTKEIYIDPVTYKQVSDPKGYEVLNPVVTKVDRVESIEKPNIPSSVSPNPEPVAKTQPAVNEQVATAPAVTDTPAAPDVYDEHGIPTVDPDSPYAPAERQISEPKTKDDAVTGSPFGDTGVANAVTASATTSKGGGFGDLVSGSKTGLKESYGVETVGPANTDITNAVRAAVEETFGPGYTVNATSGERIGGSRNHSKERGALDFGVFDPKGNPVTDKESMMSLGAALGRQGVQSLGNGKGYMGPGMMHAGAMISTGGVHGWGAKNKFANRDKEVYNAFMAERIPGAIGILPGTTTGVPTDNPMKSLMVDQPSTAEKTVASAFAPSTRWDGFDISKANPAEMAMKGLVERTPEQRSMIAKTLAGELSPHQLAALASGDENAITEFANMAVTVENRMGSKNFKGELSNVLAPSQYNSNATYAINGTVPAKNTAANYEKYGTVLDKFTNDFYDGKLTPTNPAFDQYYAANMQPEDIPSWDRDLIGKETVGGHVFGDNATNYNPSDSFRDQRSNIASQGPKGYDPNQGHGFGAYSGNNSYSKSALDAPSESGSRFGGKTGLDYGGNPHNTNGAWSMEKGFYSNPQNTPADYSVTKSTSPQDYDFGDRSRGGGGPTGPQTSGVSVGGRGFSNADKQSNTPGSSKDFGGWATPDNTNDFGGPR